MGIRDESVIANTLWMEFWECLLKESVCSNSGLHINSGHVIERWWFMKERVVQKCVWVCVGKVSKITMTWQLSFSISFVQWESMTTINQSDFCQTSFVKCIELWCHCCHESSWCVHVKLAIMATWKQFCTTHTSNLCSKSPVCRPPWTSLITQRKWIALFSGCGDIHKAAGEFFFYYFLSGFHLVCPCWCTRLLSLSKNLKWKMKTRSFLRLDDLPDFCRRFQTGNS